MHVPNPVSCMERIYIYELTISILQSERVDCIS